MLSGGLPAQAGRLCLHLSEPLFSFSAGGSFPFQSLFCRLARRSFYIRALRGSFSPLDSGLITGHHIPGIDIIQSQLFQIRLALHILQPKLQPRQYLRTDDALGIGLYLLVASSSDEAVEAHVLAAGV